MLATPNRLSNAILMVPSFALGLKTHRVALQIIYTPTLAPDSLSLKAPAWWLKRRRRKVLASHSGILKHTLRYRHAPFQDPWLRIFHRFRILLSLLRPSSARNEDMPNFNSRQMGNMTGGWKRPQARKTRKSTKKGFMPQMLRSIPTSQRPLRTLVVPRFLP